ncbi:hypothetical protein C8J57DRAFT_1253262 [Mycena rebaudengoi]|nr:hypothetical protein C8J57DRAFT_1253262 [Mycena rebaudengoi]
MSGPLSGFSGPFYQRVLDSSTLSYCIVFPRVCRPLYHPSSSSVDAAVRFRRRLVTITPTAALEVRNLGTTLCFSVSFALIKTVAINTKMPSHPSPPICFVIVLSSLLRHDDPTASPPPPESSRCVDGALEIITLETPGASLAGVAQAQHVDVQSPCTIFPGPPVIPTSLPLIHCALCSLFAAYLAFLCATPCPPHRPPHSRYRARSPILHSGYPGTRLAGYGSINKQRFKAQGGELTASERAVTVNGTVMDPIGDLPSSAVETRTARTRTARTSYPRDMSRHTEIYVPNDNYLYAQRYSTWGREANGWVNGREEPFGSNPGRSKQQRRQEAGSSGGVAR